MDQWPIRTQRLSHPALICQDLDSTLEFYQGILGMEPVAWQPAPDDPSFSHLYLHAGAGTVLAFVGPSHPARTPLAKGRLGVGGIQCLALQLEADAFDEAQTNLRQRGIAFTGPVARGHERAMWVRDPNGITLELSAWETPLPEHANHALVLKAAHHLREEEGVSCIEDRHIRGAIEQLYGAAAVAATTR